MDVSTRSAALTLTLAVGVGSALSQPSASPSPTVRGAGRPMPAASTPSDYRSSFEGYRAYSDQPLQSWRESNDTVGRIGGVDGMKMPNASKGTPAPAPAPASRAASMPGPASAPMPDHAKGHHQP